MNITVTGHGMRVGDQLRTVIEKKLSKFDRLLGPDTDASVKVRPEGDLKRVEVTMKVSNRYFRSETESDDVLTALDAGVEALERQFRKHKTRLEKRVSDRAVFVEMMKNQALSSVEDEVPMEVEAEINIVRRKNFDLAPMDPEEACLQMEMLGHSFLLFLHGDTGKVALVYKRRDGDYGLIEPEY